MKSRVTPSAALIISVVILLGALPTVELQHSRQREIEGAHAGISVVQSSIPSQWLSSAFMTTNAFAEDRQCCPDTGTNDFIAKPVAPDTLYLTITRWLDTPPAP